MDLSQAEMEQESYEPAAAAPSSSSSDPLVATLAKMTAQLAAMQSSWGQSSSSTSAPRDRDRRRGTGRSRVHVEGLTPEQLRERTSRGACFACGKEGHMKNECPNRQQQGK